MEEVEGSRSKHIYSYPAFLCFRMKRQSKKAAKLMFFLYNDTHKGEGSDSVFRPKMSNRMTKSERQRSSELYV